MCLAKIGENRGKSAAWFKENKIYQLDCVLTGAASVVAVHAVDFDQLSPSLKILLKTSHQGLWEDTFCLGSDGHKVAVGQVSGTHQVRSLTQLYSVDFSKSRISVKKCFFNKRTIKVCETVNQVVVDGVLTSAPSAAHQTVSLHLCISGSNAQAGSRALEGRCVRSKSPSSVRDGHEEVAERSGRE